MIRSCHCCRLVFHDTDNVYIVHLNFGYEEIDGKRFFYFHGALEGRKIDCIKAGKSVGFELDTNYELHEATIACGDSARFQSIIVTGNVYLIEKQCKKIYALKQIMFHHTDKYEWAFPTDILNHMSVFKLEVKELSCKEHE